MKTRAKIVLFCLCSFVVLGQKNEPNNYFQHVLEIVQEQNEGADITQLTQDLLDLKNKPTNLNTASIEQIEAIPFVHHITAKNIIDYRKEHGQIRSYSELLRINNIDRELALMIQFFTVLENQIDAQKNSSTPSKTEINFLTFQTFPKSTAYKPSDRVYPGAPRRYLMRVKSEINTRIRTGFVLEQDAGERFRTIPDFTSGFVQWKPKNTVFRKVILGDYHLHYAQNLLAGPNFALGKSVYMASWFRTQNKINPNTSSAEYGFRRGLATEIVYRKWHSIVFASYEPIDFASHISSINISGLHRTESEVNRKHNANQAFTGMLHTLNLNQLHIGMGGFIGRRSTRNSPEEIHYQLLSVNAKYRLQNGMLYGEAVRDTKQGILALNGGLIFSLTPFLNFAGIYRNYPIDFTNPLANALSSQSRNANENGLLTGLEWKINKALSINTYLDHYNNLTNSELPSYTIENTDFLAQIKWLKKRQWEVYARYRKRIELDNAISGNSALNSRHNARLHFAHMATPAVRISHRLEYYFEQSEKGMLLYLDLQWRPKSLPWSVDLRYAIFDVDEYNQRIYAYEASLPYTFSIPAHANTGNRSYCKVRYNGFKHCTIWLYYGVWKYTNLQSLSSGNNLVEGNRRREIGINLRYRL